MQKQYPPWPTHLDSLGLDVGERLGRTQGGACTAHVKLQQAGGQGGEHAVAGE